MNMDVMDELGLPKKSYHSRLINKKYLIIVMLKNTTNHFGKTKAKN